MMGRLGRRRRHFPALLIDRPPYTPAPTGGFFHRASRLVASLQLLYPGRVKHEEQNFPTRDEFKARSIGSLQPKDDSAS